MSKSTKGLAVQLAEVVGLEPDGALTEPQIIEAVHNLVNDKNKLDANLRGLVESINNARILTLVLADGGVIAFSFAGGSTPMTHREAHSIKRAVLLFAEQALENTVGALLEQELRDKIGKEMEAESSE